MKTESSTIEFDAERLVALARRHVQDQVQERQDIRLLLHDDQLALELERTVARLAGAEDGTARETDLARLAALFYPLGFRVDYTQPLAAAQDLLHRFLREHRVNPALSQIAVDVLEQVMNGRPQRPAAALLADALTIIYHGDAQRASLRQAEEELMTGQRPERLAALRLQLQQLLNLKFHTTTARRDYQPVIAQQVLELKRRLEKLARNQNDLDDVESEGLAVLEPGIPVRTAQTFFRTTYRTHINLSAIADNKANIMISVNSILISVLITFLSYRNLAETTPMVLLPTVIFLVTGLASLVFAVLSARPKITSLNHTDTAPAQLKRNLIFFGNFVQLDLDAYEEAMTDVLRDGELLTGNMLRDVYHLGKVLDKKYRYLTISYNIFMVGLVATVGTFLFAIFQ